MDEDVEDFDESLNPFNDNVEVQEKTNKLSKRKAVDSPNETQKLKRLKKVMDESSTNEDDSEEDESEDDSEDSSEDDDIVEGEKEDESEISDDTDSDEDSEEDDIDKILKQKNADRLQQQKKMKQQILEQEKMKKHAREQQQEKIKKPNQEQQQERMKKQIQEQQQKKNKQKLVNGEKSKQQEQQSNQQKKNKTEKQIQLGQPIILKEGEKRVIKGLVVEEKKLGKGEMVKSGTNVVIQITGYSKDGKCITKSAKGGIYEFKANGKEVIKGFDIGVLGMKVGGKRRLIMPPNMAYVQII